MRRNQLPPIFSRPGRRSFPNSLWGKRKERELVDKVGTVASVQASEVDVLKTLVLRSKLRTLMNVIVNGRVVKALLDTGATVSVTSRATVDKLGLPIRPVRDFIHVECANGRALPYLGYVTMSINLPHNPPSTCLALVVPSPGAVPLELAQSYEH